jgi:hypothetical protein
MRLRYMKTQELEKIRSTERWPIKFSDFYRHYIFVIIPVGMFMLGPPVFYSGLVNADSGLKLFAISIMLISLLLLIFTIRRLVQNHVFERHYFDGLTVEHIEKATKRAGFNNAKYYKKGYFQCTAGISAFSWGEVVTIVPCKDYILINSRPQRQPITIFKDRKNLSKLLPELAEPMHKVLTKAKPDGIGDKIKR